MYYKYNITPLKKNTIRGTPPEEKIPSDKKWSRCKSLAAAPGYLQFIPTAFQSSSSFISARHFSIRAFAISVRESISCANVSGVEIKPSLCRAYF